MENLDNAYERARRAAGASAAIGPAGAGRAGERSSLMNVGRRVDYALRAVSYIAAQHPDRAVSRAQIEHTQAIPPHFLSKILRRLAGAGVLESVPGARGGFRLGRPAEEISVRDVYESIEGRLCLIDCVRNGEDFCCFAPFCAQLEVWRGAQRVLREYLDSISIAHIAAGQGLVRRMVERDDRRKRERAGTNYSPVRGMGAPCGVSGENP